MKTTLVCIDRWINKEKVAYVQLNTIQRENEGYPAICNNMDRLWKGIMLNEMSQSEDDKCYMIHLCKIPRVVKIKEMESRMKIARCWSKNEMGSHFLRSIVSVLYDNEFLDFVKW